MSTPPPDQPAVTPPAEAAVPPPSGPAVLPPTQPVVPPPPARRSKLPWIIGGAALALLVIVGIVVAIVVSTILGAVRGPQEVVADYDRAFVEVDCELYLSITTEEYQASFEPTCESFEEFAQDFNESASGYVVQITGTSIEGSTATVTTTETYELDGEPNRDDYTYTLVRSGNDWLIDAIEAA